MNALSDLHLAWREYRVQHPSVRIRDGAAALGVSEAELLASDVGESVTALAKPEGKTGWGAVIETLPTLGRVMALTRNEHCVHERRGVYGAVGFFGAMGNVLGPEIDLRFFLNHWHFGFAVQEEDKDGAPKESLQFFDLDGSAVHKVYLQPESDRAAFEAIRLQFGAADQSGALEIRPADPKTPDRPDAEIDAAALRARWEAMQDTHEFYLLLREAKAGRQQAFRLIGPDDARPLEARCAEAVLRGASAAGLPIMVFVGNEGMIQIHTGEVHRIVPFGAEWINVLDPEFSLHLRQTGVVDAWTVRKPTRDGIVTSVECYDATGELVVQFFGKRKPGEPELEGWRELVATLV